jgi:hypothetical protein
LFLTFADAAHVEFDAGAVAASGTEVKLIQPHSATGTVDVAAIGAPGESRMAAGGEGGLQGNRGEQVTGGPRPPLIHEP